MRDITSIQSLRTALSERKRQGQRIGFVPTMGNLHQGHTSLVKIAKQHSDCVVVSIFVNPTQFGPQEDYDNYPRTLTQDQQLLSHYAVDYLFLPSVNEIYPEGATLGTRVIPPANLTNILCGVSRPHHFAGVATIVSKLFNIVQPDVAVLGEKDFQQLTIIQRMVTDLCMPIEILSGPTLRANDGLALSSRNNYLSQKERQQAPQLYGILSQIKQALEQGARNYTDLSLQAKNQLATAGFKPDYVEIRRALDLASPHSADKKLVILAAAWLGKTRLIDNLSVKL